jgi:hypothetical protein
MLVEHEIFGIFARNREFSWNLRVNSGENRGSRRIEGPERHNRLRCIQRPWEIQLDNEKEAWWVHPWLPNVDFVM